MSRLTKISFKINAFSLIVVIVGFEMEPYTHNEKQITLFSETDIDGIIIRVNDAFCDVSKYSRNEVIGKSHNIIRHPDMPKKLFEELWRTIRMGDTFRGVIKNKARDNS